MRTAELQRRRRDERVQAMLADAIAAADRGETVDGDVLRLILGQMREEL